MSNEYVSTPSAGPPIAAAETDPFLLARTGDEADLLPQQAADRLREARQHRDDQHALIRAAVEETHMLRTEIGEHRARLSRLRAPRGIGGHDLPEDDLRVVDEQRRLDRKVGELRRCDELIEERGARWNILSTLVRSAENWIRNVPAGTAIVMHPPMEAELKKGEDLPNAIERYRDRGRGLESSLHRIRSSSWPSVGVKEQARELIDQLAGGGAPRVDQAIAHGGQISFPTRSYQVKIFNADPSAVGFAELPDVLGLFAWLHRDALIEALNRAIDQAADDTNALAAEQRQKAEAQILDDLLSVQRQEVELVWRAQVGGSTIMQRPDIDPRALLGVHLIPAHQRVPREDEGQFGLVRHVGA